MRGNYCLKWRPHGIPNVCGIKGFEACYWIRSPTLSPTKKTGNRDKKPQFGLRKQIAETCYPKPINGQDLQGLLLALLQPGLKRFVFFSKRARLVEKFAVDAVHIVHHYLVDAHEFISAQLHDDIT